MTTFTIIVPVYNGELYISETINSILVNSLNQNKEIIVINDGSTDQTLKVLQSYKQEITIISKPNGGEANAVNQGIDLAVGRYILVVNADDPLISEELFTLTQNILDAREDLVAVYPDWQMIDMVNKVISTKYCSEYSFEELVGEFNCIPGPGTVFRANEAKQIGGRSAEYKFVSDYDFWLRLACKGYFLRIPKVLAQWRSHDASTSIGLRGYAMALERIDVVEKFLANYPQNLKLTQQARACALYNAAILAFFDPVVPGRKWMVKALGIKRGWIKSSKLHIVAYLLMLPISRSVYKTLTGFRSTQKINHK